MPKRDFLDQLIAERARANPAFPAMVDAAIKRRRMVKQLAEYRTRLGLSQTAIAAQMGTSQSAIARIESGRADTKVSTLERYAATLGRTIQWRLAPQPRSKSSARVRGLPSAANGASISRRKAVRN